MGGVGDFIGGTVNSIFGGGSEDAKKASRTAGSDVQLGVDAQREFFDRAMSESDWLRNLVQPYLGQYTQSATGATPPFGINIPSVHADQDYAAMYDPNNPETFIRTLYRDILDMNASPEMLAHWTEKMKTTSPEEALQIFRDWRTNPGYAAEYAQYGLRTNPYEQAIMGLPSQNTQAQEILQSLLSLPTQDTQSQDILTKLMGLSPDLNVTPEQLENDLTYQWQKDQATRALDATMSKIAGLNSSGRVTLLGNAMTGLTADAVERARTQKQQEFLNALNQLVSGFGQSNELFGANFARDFGRLGTGFEGASNLFNTGVTQGLQKYGLAGGMATQDQTNAYQKLLDMLKLSAGGAVSAGNWATGAGSNIANLYAGLGNTQANLQQQVGQNQSKFYQGLFGVGLGALAG